MSLSFLFKKSWHTATLQNQEKVWIQEQKHEKEQERIKELQKQVQEEREIKELQDLSTAGGHTKKREAKLDWMYDGPMQRQQELDQKAADEYLLGKKYEAKADETGANEIKKVEAAAGSMLVQLPVRSANETFRRLHEDPLLAMRQAEKRAKEALLSNPVRMGKIQAEAQAKAARKEMKKAKKAAKKEKKRERKEKGKDKKEKHKGKDREEDKGKEAGGGHRHAKHAVEKEVKDRVNAGASGAERDSRHGGHGKGSNRPRENGHDEGRGDRRERTDKDGSREGGRDRRDARDRRDGEGRDRERRGDSRERHRDTAGGGHGQRRHDNDDDDDRRAKRDDRPGYHGGDSRRGHPDREGGGRKDEHRTKRGRSGSSSSRRSSRDRSSSSSSGSSSSDSNGSRDRGESSRDHRKHGSGSGEVRGRKRPRTDGDERESRNEERPKEDGKKHGKREVARGSAGSGDGAGGGVKKYGLLSKDGSSNGAGSGKSTFSQADLGPDAKRLKAREDEEREKEEEKRRARRRSGPLSEDEKKRRLQEMEDDARARQEHLKEMIAEGRDNSSKKGRAAKDRHDGAADEGEGGRKGPEEAAFMRELTSKVYDGGMTLEERMGRNKHTRQKGASASNFL